MNLESIQASHERMYGTIDSFRQQASLNVLGSSFSCERGVLVEGVDYSGKTSVCNALQGNLEQSGVRTNRAACFMNNHPILTALLNHAKLSNELRARDVCYTACLLLDLTLPTASQNQNYRIQERHVVTQIGRNTFFYQDHENWHIETLRNLRRMFTCQVYLTSNLDAKKERVKRRPAKSPRDVLLAADPSLLQYYDEAMLASLPANEEWHVIDTSYMTIRETCDVLENIVFETDLKK